MKIVGITACPTGIAHTYMAAEALTKAAQEMGHEIKIETQGVEVENILSDNDIQSADIVIIACQKTVDLSRFEGKRVTEIPIERAVKNPQKVIQDAIDGKNISIFELAKEDKAKKKAQQTGIYKSFFLEVLKLLAFQGVWMFRCSQFPLFFPLPEKNKGTSYCTLSSSFAASRLASLLACA